MAYGVEIWKEREAVEGVQERYLRWMLGVSRMTPRYMIREKLQREKLRTRAGRRAWRMEERLVGDRGSELVRKCWKEVRERARRGEDCRVGKGKGRVSSKTGIEMGEMEREREEELLDFGKLEMEDRNGQKEERWKKIKGGDIISSMGG